MPLYRCVPEFLDPYTYLLLVWEIINTVAINIPMQVSFCMNINFQNRNLSFLNNKYVVAVQCLNDIVRLQLSF